MCVQASVCQGGLGVSECVHTSVCESDEGVCAHMREACVSKCECVRARVCISLTDCGPTVVRDYYYLSASSHQ